MKILKDNNGRARLDYKQEAGFNIIEKASALLRRGYIKGQEDFAFNNLTGFSDFDSYTECEGWLMGFNAAQAVKNLKLQPSPSGYVSAHLVQGAFDE